MTRRELQSRLLLAFQSVGAEGLSLVRLRRPAGKFTTLPWCSSAQGEELT